MATPPKLLCRDIGGAAGESLLLTVAPGARVPNTLGAGSSLRADAFTPRVSAIFSGTGRG